MNRPDEGFEGIAASARHLGADFFGVADLTPPHVLAHVVSQSGEQGLAQYGRAVSIGIAQAGGIVDFLPKALQADDPVVAYLYESHIYNILVPRLDAIALHVASILQRQGHRVIPVPGRLSEGRLPHSGFLSHKLAAHLAGLGWIGKSCLLVTPQVGPRVMWATVLTTAPLQAGEPMEERCGACRECVDICPAEAFTGRTFVESEPREARMSAERCHAFRDERAKVLGRRTCSMCLYICPHGRRPT